MGAGQKLLLAGQFWPGGHLLPTTALGDYSFCILITLDFIKPYGNIVNLYGFFLIKSILYLTILSLYLEGFSILAPLCGQLSLNYINING